MTQADLGLIGLGAMGAMLALNLAEKGFKVAVHDVADDAFDTLQAQAADLCGNLMNATSLEQLVGKIAAPKPILMMVPAGSAVDGLIDRLAPFLSAGDILIDAGNSSFRDTRRREEALRGQSIEFLGLGVSGGSEGARHGPALMAGCSKAAWARMADMFQAIAASYEGNACAARLGPDGAGHFVKTVHNGIEYAEMQIIAEVYGILRFGEGQTPEKIGEAFQRWNGGVLQSYLVEITGKVLSASDPETGEPMVDVILDRAGQKGTGRWTAIEAQHLGVNTSIIDAAVGARNLSTDLDRRKIGASLFGGGARHGDLDGIDPDLLEQAMMAARILSYAQGFDLLKKAGQVFRWDLPLAEIAKLWRSGCIIRAGMLQDMAEALGEEGLANLCFAPELSKALLKTEPALRAVVLTALDKGIPVPALSAALTYFDGIRTDISSASLLQAQRDYFGAHGFERRDADGQFHGPWR